MHRILLIIIIALTSCKSVEAPTPIKPPAKVKKIAKPKAKAEEKKEEKVEIVDNKLGYEISENEEKERKEVDKQIQASNEDSWFGRIWGNFKVNRAVSLLKELDRGKVYRTEESILLVMRSDDMTDDILSELMKIYSLQDGGITIYSNLNIKDKLALKGLAETKMIQRSRSDGNTVIRLAVVE